MGYLHRHYIIFFHFLCYQKLIAVYRYSTNLLTGQFSEFNMS